jgi:pimeloyl-ACP methyl ester carboxylesterase
MIQRYHAFQHAGLANLASRSQVTETPGGKIEYAVQGDGPAILVSHGSFGGFDQGLLSVYFLKDIQVRFIVPSRFGYLRTPLPIDATPAAQARAYVALLDHLGIEKVWMLGLSAGGMSILEFALQFPERCLGLVMVSAVSARPVKAPPIRFMVEHVLTNGFLGWTLATYGPRLVAQSTGDNYSLVAHDLNLKNAFLSLAWPPFATQRRVGMLNDLNQADRLPNYPFEKIDIPLLVAHGTANPFVPYDTAKRLAARVRGAKLLSFENGGHLGFLTQHEKTRTAMVDFMNTHSPKGIR